MGSCIKAQSVQEVKAVKPVKGPEQDKVPSIQVEPAEEHPLRPTHNKHPPEKESNIRAPAGVPANNSWGGKLSEQANNSLGMQASAKSISRGDRPSGSQRENKVEHTKNSLRDIATKK